MFKYTIIAYIILLSVFVYELSIILPISKRIEQKVMGISTQIKQYQALENSIK